MLIDIRGVGFVNKGAELMLHAVLQKVREALPHASIAMAPIDDQDYARRAALGLYQKVSIQKYGVSLADLMSAGRRNRYRKHYGLVFDKDINLVLDASGFAYGDQFSDSPSVAMASLVKRCKKRGTKVVLLPQAMGPFSRATTREAFTYIAENADLVFPRDSMSYKHVVDLVGTCEHIQQAPDFTNLVPGIRPDHPERYEGRFCLVPNYRMMDMTSEEVSGLYPSFCAACIRLLTASRHKPFILIHEGPDDERLAERIANESQEQIEILREADPLRIKGILGFCAGVIGSRYHSLISALSQGVPALATGWSHKYKMLFEEYGIPDSCLEVTIKDDTLCAHIEKLTDEGWRKQVSGVIAEAAATYKEQTEMMWQKVFAAVAK